jgi:Na+-translocating ferredoxin:NAD+ oxidoreductase RnfA subunit
MAFFIGSLFIVALILVYFLFLCRKYNTDLSKSIQTIILVGLEITVVVFLQALCKDEKLSRALFGLYFCSTDWLMFAIARFFPYLYQQREIFKIC